MNFEVLIGKAGGRKMKVPMCNCKCDDCHKANQAGNMHFGHCKTGECRVL